MCYKILSFPCFFFLTLSLQTMSLYLPFHHLLFLHFLSKMNSLTFVFIFSPLPAVTVLPDSNLLELFITFALGLAPSSLFPAFFFLNPLAFWEPQSGNHWKVVYIFLPTGNLKFINILFSDFAEEMGFLWFYVFLILIYVVFFGRTCREIYI